MTHCFVPFAFLSLSLLSCKYLYVFALNQTSSFIICPLNSFLINPTTFSFLPLGNGMYISKF